MDKMASRSESDEIYKGKNSADQEKEGLLPSSKFGKRHTLVFWAFLGFLILFVLRVDMSIALVAMATQNSTSATDITSNNSECADVEIQNRTVSTTSEFHWSNKVQGFVLSAFYYGYFATQIPGSLLVRRVGGKMMFMVAMAGCTILAALTPLSARLHVGVLIANRVVQGCLQGVVFPAMQLMLSRWVPPRERSRLVACTYAGCQAGTVLGLLSAGYICESCIGWSGVFYIEGGLGLLWCIAWMWFVSDSPSTHPRISDNERAYLERCVEVAKHKAPRIPWLSIITSPALYAIAGAHFANDWGSFAIMTCLPKFLKDILKFDLSQNGFLSALPYLVTWACNIVAGALADFLRKPNRLRTVHVRKIMVFVGLIGPATLLLVAAYLPGCGKVSVVVLLTMAMGLSGFTIAGHSVNHLDIAPSFASLLFAMTNSFGTTSGWIGPALAGALTDHDDTRRSWQTFFLISGAVYGTGGTIFVLLAKGDLQPWAKVEDTDKSVTVAGGYYGSTQVADDSDSDNDSDSDIEKK